MLDLEPICRNTYSHRTLQRISGLAICLTMVLNVDAGSPATALASRVDPTEAASQDNQQVGGSGFYEDPDDPVCPAPPASYDSYPALVISGSLEGCWYTNVLTSKTTPSGVYLETGEELFVGELNGIEGTFSTTYRFEAKLLPDGTEIRGRCQHPIVAGTGTGVFADATGIILFKDAPPEFFYRGHISL